MKSYVVSHVETFCNHLVIEHKEWTKSHNYWEGDQLTFSSQSTERREIPEALLRA